MAQFASAAATALLLTFALSACSGESSPSLMGAWKAREVQGKAVDGPTLDVSANGVSGSGGCNTYRGPLTHEGGKLKIGPLAATRMMCEGKMETEQALLSALEAATSFDIETAALVLKDASGADVAKFIR